jgi:hypothetical protein
MLRKRLAKNPTSIIVVYRGIAQQCLVPVFLSPVDIQSEIVDSLF